MLVVCQHCSPGTNCSELPRMLQYFISMQVPVNISATYRGCAVFMSLSDSHVGRCLASCRESLQIKSCRNRWAHSHGPRNFKSCQGWRGQPLKPLHYCLKQRCNLAALLYQFCVHSVGRYRYRFRGRLQQSCVKNTRSDV